MISEYSDILSATLTANLCKNQEKAVQRVREAIQDEGVGTRISEDHLGQQKALKLEVHFNNPTKD